MRISRPVGIPTILTLLGLVFAGLSMVAPPSPAGGASGATTATGPVASQSVNPKDPAYKVTMVARSCPLYTDVFANRARNDIMESLQNLGPDNPYGNNFQQILPSFEDGLSPQTNCTPLPNWTFTFGTGINRPVPGTNLSYVTGSSTVNRQETTQASVPLLDGDGNPTGSTIAGATTFTLTQAEVDLASRNSRYWVMGGTTTQPLNGQGSTYGFAALRCAKDDLNGDNVEWIAYPSGYRHVFCYAFYVQPPTPPGQITVRKQLSAGENGTQRFDFSGDLSFNPNGAFSLQVDNGAPAQTTFVRGSSVTYRVTEDGVDGWDLVSVACSSAGGSTFDYSLARSARITLAANDNVTCTFTNGPVVEPTGTVQVTKTTLGYFGAFDFNVAGTPQTLTTTADGQTVEGGAVGSLLPGPNTISETLPTTTIGSWSLTAVTCDGNDVTNTVTSPQPNVRSVPITISGPGHICNFQNVFTPTTGLRIRLRTIGATGSAAFVIDQQGNVPAQFTQSATTTSENTFAPATGDSTDPLFGQVVIAPVGPADTDAGTWTIEGTPVCDNARGAGFLNIGPEQLRVNVGSISLQPLVTCDYTYRFTPGGSLNLAKVITGDTTQWTGPVTVRADCADGSSAELVVPAGSAPMAGLTEPLTFTESTTCTVAETTNGAATGAAVTTTHVVRADGSTIDGTLTPLDIAGRAVQVTFTNSYAAAAPASTTPTTAAPTTAAPTTAPAPTAAPMPRSPARLAATGAGQSLVQAALRGLSALCLGMSLVLAQVGLRRRRTGLRTR